MSLLLGLLYANVLAQEISVPAKNKWLTDSVYPMSHYNPGQTDVASVAGPLKGKKLTVKDAKTVAVAWCSAPTVKRIGDETIVIASNPHGLIKIRATGEDFEVISNVPYPHMEEIHAKVSPRKIADVMANIDEKRRKKQGIRLMLYSWLMYRQFELNERTMGSGAYAVIDKDGYHYTFFDRLHIIKSFDNNEVDAPLRPLKYVNVAENLPEDIASGLKRILGISMTYDGHLIAAAGGAVFVLDRELTVKDHIIFPDEKVENCIALDENNGIYIVTSKTMRKVVWTGEHLSDKEADGAWISPYDTMPEGESYDLGALSIGSGTTPTLLGFGDDEDKLVVISDANREGAHIVAFWRDQIPDDFKQKPGTLTRRIADQMRIKISHVTVEASPVIYGNGVLLLNSTYPEPSPITMDAIGNAFMSGITRPAPTGVQKFEWQSVENRFKESWLLKGIDNTDWMPPAVSPETGLVYIANKRNSTYEYIGVDWETGEIKACWEFPNDSVLWNNWGGITTLLEDGDFLLGGFFAVKRYNVGH